MTLSFLFLSVPSQVHLTPNRQALTYLLQSSYNLLSVSQARVTQMPGHLLPDDRDSLQVF